MLACLRVCLFGLCGGLRVCVCVRVRDCLFGCLILCVVVCCVVWCGVVWCGVVCFACRSLSACAQELWRATVSSLTASLAPFLVAFCLAAFSKASLVAVCFAGASLKPLQTAISSSEDNTSVMPMSASTMLCGMAKGDCCDGHIYPLKRTMHTCHLYVCVWRLIGRLMDTLVE